MRLSLQAALDLLYPPRCAGCGRTGAWLCAACLPLCVPHGGDCCERCGTHVVGQGRHSCDGLLLHLDGLKAAYRYSGPVRPLVHSFKYDNWSAAAGWMAARMVPAAPVADMVVPVPLHPRRKKERGYNQAELLARVVSERTGARLAHAVRRSGVREAQARLSAEERWLNVRGAFEPAGGAPVRGTVLLVDDVCTTGATLEECATVLKGLGADRVIGLVFARA